MIEHLIRLLRPLHFRGKHRLLNRLAPRSGTRTLRVAGFEMTLDLSDFIQRSIYLGTYEQKESRLFRRLLSAGDTAVDVGANVGFFTAHALAAVGKTGRVIAIEPSPIAFATLRHWLERAGAVHCRALNFGLGDCAGELNLYWNPDGDNHTPSMVPVGDGHHIRVPVRRLDDVLEELSVNEVTLLKIDVEGFELRVLRGASRALSERRFAYILLEFSAPWLTAAGTSPGEIDAVLRSNGYRPAGRDPTMLGPRSVANFIYRR